MAIKEKELRELANVWGARGHNGLAFSLGCAATELTRLRSDLEKAKEALSKSDAMQQLAYANGMKEGWNLGDAGDSETHAKRVAALVQEAMKELKDIRLLSQLENSKKT